MAKHKFKERVRVIDLKPFPYEVKLVVTDSIIETERIIRKGFNDHCTKIVANDNTSAMAMHHKNARSMYLIMPYSCDIGYIAHEVWHIVRALMLNVGATFENEVMAYYIGHLTREAARWNSEATDAHEEESTVIGLVVPAKKKVIKKKVDKLVVRMIE